MLQIGYVIFGIFNHFLSWGQKARKAHTSLLKHAANTHCPYLGSTPLSELCDYKAVAIYHDIDILLDDSAFAEDGCW